ncbi:MAG: DUF4127 family protein [Anaerolineae bacterium]|nr:DUF4127 family protein [Anaerolineae bacterium]
MMSKVALIPLDDRPPNYDFPQYVGRIAGVEVLLPPREWLGNLWRGAQIERIALWLRDIAPQVDAAIIALDTLGYGGLVNSRTSYDDVDTVLGRLALLREIKREYPNLTLLGFNVLMRITRGNTSEEEKPYWATYGARMFRLSYLSDKADMGDASPEEIAERDRLADELPQEVVQDYLDGRARNHVVNKAMLQWTREGVFDYLLIPQDDTMEYGWNIAESRALRQEIQSLGLTDRAITYPGADEIGMILLARVICQENGIMPRVWARYASCRADGVITAYEDRPMPELIKAHLAPMGGILVGSPEEADFLLFVNSPGEMQGEGVFQLPLRWSEEELTQYVPQAARWIEKHQVSDSLRATRREMYSVFRNVDEFVRAAADYASRGSPVAIADVAFVNGADLALGDRLMEIGLAPRLAGYAGWNTAGNTLGTALAHAVARVAHLRRGEDREGLRAHLAYLFLRFLDDYIYQAIARTEVMLLDLPTLGLEPTMGELPRDVEAVQARVSARLQERAGTLIDLFRQTSASEPGWPEIAEIEVRNIYLPWKRLFEIGCDVSVRFADEDK